MLRLLALVLPALLFACAAPPAVDADARAQLAPGGTLRVAVLVGPAANVFRAKVDAATARPAGVPVDLAAALGRRLAVPVEQRPYGNYPDLLAAAARGEWDVTFLPYSDERAKVLDFGHAYALLEYTYLVPAGSTLREHADVDRAGVRVVVAEGSVSESNRAKALRQATLVRLRTLGEIREQLQARGADAFAASRETLLGLAAELPGALLLPGSFHRENVAVAVPTGRPPQALQAASAFVEALKADGQLRRTLDAAGFQDVPVAPPQAPR